MIRRRFLWSASALAAMAVLPALSATKLPELEVFKSPYCGCCGAWIEHMKGAGFSVKVTPVTDTSATRKRLGLAERYASCHTSTIGDYVLEGHIPAAEVKRLLAMKPKALGLAVPGMPAASPGMATPGRKDPYDVLLIGTEGQSRVFASYPE